MSYPAYPQNLPRTFRCANHPEREGIGICVSCRSVVCVECSTKIDRMNYCIKCLQASAEPVEEASRSTPLSEAAAGIPVLIGAFLLAVGIFALMGFLLANWRVWVPGGVSGG